MNQLTSLCNPYADGKVIDACAIFGMMDTAGGVFSGEPVVAAIANMHARSNGLGGGFAVYGLYPDRAQHYAFHVMCLNHHVRSDVEEYLTREFRVVDKEEIPTRLTPGIADAPVVWRYFLDVDKHQRQPYAME